METILKHSIPYNRQTIDDADLRAVNRVLKSQFLTTGPEARNFESEICQFVGAKYAVVCSSGTAALHMAMLALGLCEEDSLVTTPITFVADANCARYVGAEVIFADIDPETINISVESVENILRENANVKVVVPVHYAGQPVDMESLYRVCSRYNVTIVEDACHALGAAYTTNSGASIKVGSCKHSRMTVFSFHPIKSITTGEGGCITTNDEALYKKLLKYRSHGNVKGVENVEYPENAFTLIDGKTVPNAWYYETVSLGYNYRITDFQCALGSEQLKKCNKFVERRRHLADRYRELITSKLSSWVKMILEAKNIRHAHHLFPVRIDFSKLKGGRGALMHYLLERGISTQVHYIPIYHHPYYKKRYGAIVCSNAEAYYAEALSLPLYPLLTETEQDYVVRSLEECIDALRLE